MTSTPVAEDASETPQAPGLLSRLDELDDADLVVLNNLLPWSAYVVDGKGRRFGRPHSPRKRWLPQELPDARIVELDRRVSLADKTVLEVGRFEGIHTVALAQRARSVTAVDGRVENVVKTMVRCGVFGVAASVRVWDVERDPPPTLDLSWDVLHHVGVLYHLVDPVGHLRRLLPHVRHSIMLDITVAPPEKIDAEDEVAGRRYRYYTYPEGSRQDPFSGMYQNAKWLLEEDVLAVLKDCGFAHADVAHCEVERYGPRIRVLYAKR